MYQPLERATGTLEATIRGSENRIGKLIKKAHQGFFFLKTFRKLRNVLLLIQLAASQEVINLSVR